MVGGCYDVYKKIGLSAIASFLIIPSAYALENLTEDDLAQTIGQDGVTMAFIHPAAGWVAQEMEK